MGQSSPKPCMDLVLKSSDPWRKQARPQVLVRPPTARRPGPVKLGIGAVLLLARVGVELIGVLVDLPEAIVRAGLAFAAERQFPWPGWVLKSFAGISITARFEEQHAGPSRSQHPGGSGPTGAAAYYDYVILFHQNSAFKLNCRMRGPPSVEVILAKLLLPMVPLAGPGLRG